VGELPRSWLTAVPENFAAIVKRTRELTEALVAGPDDLVESLVAALDIVEEQSP
jgi:hypothetical protein